jgi:transposase-like protein
MTIADPHYFDCPSCKAFATLRRLDRRRGHTGSDEYECQDCHSRYGTEELEREAAKRKAID